MQQFCAIISLHEKQLSSCLVVNVLVVVPLG